MAFAKFKRPSFQDALMALIRVWPKNQVHLAPAASFELEPRGAFQRVFSSHIQLLELNSTVVNPNILFHPTIPCCETCRARSRLVDPKKGKSLALDPCEKTKKPPQATCHSHILQPLPTHR